MSVADARELGNRASVDPDVVATLLDLPRLDAPGKVYGVPEDWALTIDEAAHGPDHPHVANSLSNLASVLGDLGLPEATHALAQHALAIRKVGEGN